ncbi:DNA-binding protein Alba [Candidatus Woesearchaeota archaeon]|nr:DNA-binding protein Alba [Candidatus Woesearchaeota archaeon]
MPEETQKDKPAETKPVEKKFDKDSNSIFVGGKPFMNYVTGVVMQFTTKDADEVVIKARGKFISRAVDIAEVAAKRFLERTSEIKDIKIDSEEFQNNEGKTVRVSTIEITLKKKQIN